MTLATSDDVESFVTGHPGWTSSGQELVRTFVFTDFAGSMQFVNVVAEMAEKADHHPDLDIRWNRVKVALSTHSEGGITDKDLGLADRIDKIGG
jgi:4a-hydroxytetrahydrobiopterin dehydratase